MLINRVIRISSYIGQELKELKNFHTRKILIEFMLAENDKTYHVYGKLTTKQKSKMYFLPKTQVYDDPYFEPINVDVDFSKYNDILSQNNKNYTNTKKMVLNFV
jgi:hypothetical protein